MVPPPYLIEIHKSVPPRSVHNEVLDLAILAELDLEHLLCDLGPHPVAPDTLRGHAQAEAKPDTLTRYHLPSHPPHRLHYGLDVHELNEGVVRLLDVNFKDFAELFKPFVDFRWNNLKMNI